MAASYSTYVMLSLKYAMQELYLNDIYVSHWSFEKCKFRIMRPVLKFATFFFSLKILSPKILPKIRSSATRAYDKVIKK